MWLGGKVAPLVDRVGLKLSSLCAAVFAYISAYFSGLHRERRVSPYCGCVSGSTPVPTWFGERRTTPRCRSVCSRAIVSCQCTRQLIYESATDCSPPVHTRSYTRTLLYHHPGNAHKHISRGYQVPVDPHRGAQALWFHLAFCEERYWSWPSDCARYAIVPTVESLGSCLLEMSVGRLRSMVKFFVSLEPEPHSWSQVPTTSACALICATGCRLVGDGTV